jgi:hypothetical protein
MLPERYKLSTIGKLGNGGKVPKTLKVDRKQFEGIVKSLINSAPLKREDVKVGKKKPHKVIPSPKLGTP